MTDIYDVRAFRPRVPDVHQVRVQVKGAELGARDIRWDASRVKTDRSRCDLTLHVPGYIEVFSPDSVANQRTVEAVFVLLDHLVGEWAVEAQVGHIAWRSIKEAADLPTLVTLPDYLDRIAAE